MLLAIVFERKKKLLRRGEWKERERERGHVWFQWKDDGWEGGEEEGRILVGQ